MVSTKLNLLQQSNRDAAFILIILLFAGLVIAANQPSMESTATIKKDLKWSTSYSESVQRAKAKKIPVLIKFEASWCVYCQKMEEEVYTDPEVIKELDKFVLVKIDVDKNSAVAKSYKIKSLPRTIVINIHDEIVGDWLGYHEASAFAKLLRDVDEYTHTQTGTTSMPSITEEEVSDEIQNIPEINPGDTDELISFLGHKNAGVNRTTTYDVLESLNKKGLVLKYVENNKVGYTTEGPNKLKNWLTNKENQLDKQKDFLNRIYNN